MTARIWNFRRWIKETDPDRLSDRFNRLITDAGFTVLAITDHYFTPQGYTRLYLLSESHFAIHTFPEAGKTYIELSSCNKSMFKQFKRQLKSVNHKET